MQKVNSNQNTMGHSLGISLKSCPQLLLHFLIHIDVIMLSRKYELIPMKNFQVMTIFKNGPIFENYPVL